MKVLLMSILSIFLLSSCAHKDVSYGPHHHHKCEMKSCQIKGEKGETFKKHCAMSVANGDMHVKGKKEYKIEHNGEIFYFSTKEKMKNFKENMEENINQAKLYWFPTESVQ